MYNLTKNTHTHVHILLIIGACACIFCSSFLTVDKDQKVRLNKRSLGAAVQESHAHSPSKAWSLPALGVIGGLVLLTAAVLMCVKSSRLVCPCVSLPLIILFLFSLSLLYSPNEQLLQPNVSIIVIYSAHSSLAIHSLTQLITHSLIHSFTHSFLY